MKIYYAQNKEDLFIKAFFPDIKKGTYIDVGANDPVIDSVTKLFYDEGWHGTNIDPIRRHIVSLKKYRPRDINLQMGVGAKEEERLFTEYPMGDGISTFSDAMVGIYDRSNSPTEKRKQYMVHISTLTNIIKENEIKNINFLKIDVEGYEYEVVSGYDWSKPMPELLCIEASHIINDWRPLIESKGYKLVFFDGVNNYYLSKEALHREKYFNYADAALSGTPIYYPTYKYIEENSVKKAEKQKNKVARKTTETLEAKIADLEKEVNFLHDQQRSIRFLLKRLNQEISTALNRKAKLNISVTPQLTYKQDRSIVSLVNGGDKITAKKIVEDIHLRDKKNIILNKPSLFVYVISIFWKVVARLYSLNTKLMRKLAKI